MVTCESCGRPCTREEDFCGACGAYLSWDAPAATPQRPPVTPVTPVTPTTPAPPVAPPGARPSPRRPRAERAERAGRSGPPPTTPPKPTEPPHVPSPSAATTPLGPLDPTGPGAPVQPNAVLPGEAVEQPRPETGRPPAPERPPAPGELICGQCGAGNVPSRRFCRRCGSSLADAPVAARPPWWRRLFGRPFTRRRRPAPVAGERPRQPRERRRSRLLVPLVLLLLLAGAGYTFRAELGEASEAVRDRISTPEAIHVTALHASSEDPAHPAAAAVDGTTDRYWAPARPGPGQGEYLEAEFAGPFRLLDVLIRPGSSPNAEQFLTQARPQTVTLTITRSDSRISTRTVHLADAPGEQRFHFGVSDVVRIRLTVDAAYGTGAGRQLALAEVEFFKRP